MCTRPWTGGRGEMRTSYHQFCAVARTLDAIGSRWTLLIVRELVLRGPLTAAAIRRGPPGVPPNQPAERLGRPQAPRGAPRVREARRTPHHQLAPPRRRPR